MQNAVEEKKSVERKERLDMMRRGEKPVFMSKGKKAHFFLICWFLIIVAFVSGQKN